MVIESEQLASSVINHSGLFSANIPIIFKSGVPYTFDYTTGHSFYFTIALERASTLSSTSSHESHSYPSKINLPEFEYSIFLVPKNGFFVFLQTDLLKHFKIVSQPM